MFTKDVYLILMNHCTHLEILKRIFKVVFLFSYQSSVLKEPCIHQCFFKFLSLPYRGDLIIIAPHPGYVNNFFQLFSIFLNFFLISFLLFILNINFSVSIPLFIIFNFSDLFLKQKANKTYIYFILPRRL